MNDVVLVTSPFVQKLAVSCDKWVIYHSLKGNPLIADRGALDILELFQRPVTLGYVETEYEIDEVTRQTIFILIHNQLLVPFDCDERREHLDEMLPIIQKVVDGDNVRVLDLSVSELCNFGCRYCIHSRALSMNSSRMGRSGLMTKEMAAKAVNAFLAHLNQLGIDSWSLHFGSAEALLNIRVVEWVTEYLEKIGANPEDISINTNLSLMTREIAIFFRDRCFRVNTSIDGLPNINDTVRVYKNGRGTAQDILRGIELIRSVGHYINGIGITLCDTNFEYVDDEIVDWLTQQQIPNVLFDIDSVNWVNLNVDEAARKFVRFEKLCREVGIRVDGCWKTAYENIRDSGISGVKGFCASLMGNNILVAPSGNLYYCTYSATSIGHINNFPQCLQESPYRDLMTKSYQGDFPECQGCSIEGHCLGGCLLTREGDDQQRKVAQMCQFYRSATEQLLILDVEEEGGEKNAEEKKSSGYRQSVA